MVGSSNLPAPTKETKRETEKPTPKAGFSLFVGDD